AKRRAEPVLGRRPTVLTRRPRPERACADDQPFRREQEHHPGGDAHRAGPGLALADRELRAELRDVGGQLARGGLASHGDRAERRGGDLREPLLPAPRAGPPPRCSSIRTSRLRWPGISALVHASCITGASSAGTTNNVLRIPSMRTSERRPYSAASSAAGLESCAPR